MTRRIVAAAILLTVVGAGLVVHLALPDTDGTDIAGDVLYPLAVYALIVLIAPGSRPVLVGALTLVWCVGVELLQLTGLPQVATSAFPPVVLVLGTVFDPRDLVVYLVTAILATLVDIGIRRVSSRGGSMDAVEERP